MTSNKQAPSRSGISGLVFIGCLLIALAVGIFTGNVAPVLLAGLGIGFIAMAIARFATGQW